MKQPTNKQTNFLSPSPPSLPPLSLPTPSLSLYLYLPSLPVSQPPSFPYSPSLFIGGRLGKQTCITPRIAPLTAQAPVKVPVQAPVKAPVQAHVKAPVQVPVQADPLHRYRVHVARTLRNQATATFRRTKKATTQQPFVTAHVHTTERSFHVQKYA